MTVSLSLFLLVAIGGAVGGVLRVWVTDVIAARFGASFPWGTLVVNLTGSLLVGGIAGLFMMVEGLQGVDGPVWTLIAVGALGSYTTVSSFSLQTLDLFQSGSPLKAAANVAITLASCLIAAFIGMGVVVSVLPAFAA